MKRIVASLVLAFATLACSQQDSEPAAGSADSSHVDPSAYAAAVANASRPEADLARDAGRKPAEVLGFFGIAPGMSVLDLFSGGGYYAEILSHVVGPEGHIVAHSNSAYLNFVGDEFKARHADNRPLRTFSSQTAPYRSRSFRDLQTSIRPAFLSCCIRDKPNCLPQRPLYRGDFPIAKSWLLIPRRSSWAVGPTGCRPASHSMRSFVR